MDTFCPHFLLHTSQPTFRTLLSCAALASRGHLGCFPPGTNFYFCRGHPALQPFTCVCSMHGICSKNLLRETLKCRNGCLLALTVNYSFTVHVATETKWARHTHPNLYFLV